MKKHYLLIIVLIFMITMPVDAKRGCCSGKDGIAYCGESGHYVCNNGEVSPSCTCDEPDYTTYEEDAANGNLYYGEAEDFIDENEEENMEVLQKKDKSHLYIEDSAKNIIKEETGNVLDYIEIITLFTAVAGVSYLTGKTITKRK